MSFKPNKCIRGIKLQPNPKYQLSFTDFDQLSCEFELGEGWEQTLYAVGDTANGVGSIVGTNLRSLICESVTIRSQRGTMMASVNFKGIVKEKRPTGGGGYFLNEEPIPTHPNYSHRPDTWVKKEAVFGEGPSPNRFGRITDANGAFKRFGPPEEGISCTLTDKPETWSCKLEGVESYLSIGQLGYEYRVLTTKRWGDELIEDIGKIASPESEYVPPPKADQWLFIGLSEDIQTIGNTEFYTTTAQYLSSTKGGWHPWIYEGGKKDHDLDSKAGVR